MSASMTNPDKSLPNPKSGAPATPYTGTVAASFALHTLDNRPLFMSESTVKVFETALTSQATRCGCDAVVYLFLPDRCHVVLRGKENKSNVLEAIDSFRQETREWFLKNRPDIDWSDDLQDQILKRDDDLASQIESILEAPVRNGIVKQWREYKFKGSTIFDLDSWLYPL